MSLLQKITVARKVSHPGLCLFRPSLVTGEPLPKGPQGETWLLVEQGLVNRGVNDEAVQPHGQFLVGGWFESGRRPGPGSGGRRQGLGSHKVLAVEMSDRGGFSDIGVVTVQLFVHTRGLCPCSGHGNGVAPFYLHAVANERAAL